MAAIKLNVLIRQGLNRRTPDIATLTTGVDAWQRNRNTQKAVINWQFTTKEARIKLERFFTQNYKCDMTLNENLQGYGNFR